MKNLFDSWVEVMAVTVLAFAGVVAGFVLATSTAPPQAECGGSTTLTEVQLVRVLDLTVYGMADKNTTNRPQRFECRPVKRGRP